MQEAIDAILAEQRAVAQVTEGRRPRRVLGEERSVELEHPEGVHPGGVDVGWLVEPLTWSQAVQGAFRSAYT